MRQMQTTTLLSITVGVLTGLVGFVMGVLLQQDASYRGIYTAMENDPYIYRKRKHIFKAVCVETKQVSFEFTLAFLS